MLIPEIATSFFSTAIGGTIGTGIFLSAGSVGHLRGIVQMRIFFI